MKRQGGKKECLGAVSSLAVALAISRKVKRDDYKRDQSIMLKK